MYGMYGKNGSGVSPKIPDISDIPYTGRAECPVAPTGHFARLRESRGNGWHTDFGTKYSVLYPSRRGTETNAGWRWPAAFVTGPKRSEGRCRYRHPPAAHGFRSRDGDSPLPGLPDYNKGGPHGIRHFTICKAQGRRVQGAECPPRADKGQLRQQPGH